MTDYNDGKWHGWNGGECPVHPKSEVVVKWSCNGVETDPVEAWCIISDHWNDGSICAFRVTKPYREPREFWVNEYEDGVVVSHKTKEASEFNKYPRFVRTIHLREVIEE